MPNHNEQQRIPVVHVPPTPITRAQWLAFFDSAYAAQVSVDIHVDELHHHAEESLRLWAKSRNLACVERETRPEHGSPYINLSVTFRAGSYATLGGVTIYKIRELVRVEPEANEPPEYPFDAAELGHDDERGVYEREGVPPDSDEVLGTSLGTARY